VAAVYGEVGPGAAPSREQPRGSRGGAADLLPVSASQWKTLRTTNAIERVIEEGRRRIKTQGVLPSVGAVVTILYGLVATGQLVLRRIDGYQDLGKVLNRAVA
jgi:hypothetical protein